MALTLTACGGGGGSSGGGADTGTLNLGAILPATTMAAADANWATESPYIQAVYDSLLRESPDAEPEPWLATSWSYDDTKTVLTLKLRTDVKFTDGTPFDASVAAQNILRFRDGTSPNKSDLASVKDATAVDPATLQITLTAPDPTLLINLARNGGAQESPKAFTASDIKTNPVGSGPYTLDTGKTVVGSKYVYKKNPDYWAPKEQHFDNLVINVYQTTATQVNAVRGGQIDGTNMLDNTANDQIKAAGYQLVTHELDWVGLILFDRDGAMNPALGDAKVRQAINYAIDRPAMLKAAGRGFGTVTEQIFGEQNPGYDKSLEDTYSYDPDKAKQLLADAGYGSGLTIQMPQIQVGSTTVFDLVKQYLGDVGITVDYVPIPLSQAIPDILGAKYAASYFQLQANPSAWGVAKFNITPDATWNVFHTQDPTVDGLLTTIQTGSDDQSADAAKQLNKFVVEQAWFAPFYRVQGTFAASQDLKVVQQADNAYPYLYNITPKS
jgi:peptide/nickel transport system substrate-binding protein